MESIGGQAVIEGVMMRSPKYYSVAVRKPNEKIQVKKVKHVSWTKRNWFTSLPLIRGMIVLVECAVIGTRALNMSAVIAGKEDGVELKGYHLFFMVALAIILGLFIFKLLPLAVPQLLGYFFSSFKNLFVFNLTEGLVKIGLLFLYLFLISQMKDVKRLFQYHGAEHKVVNCYEAGKSLVLKNIKKFSTIHPRCGSSFILLVLLISIVFYILIPLDINFFAKLGVRILLLPVIAGVTYELIRLGSKYKDNWLAKILLSPGALVQKITTSEPDNKQIEVAVAALKKIKN